MLQSSEDLDDLTSRERQIADAYASGQSYKEIAEELGIAPGTVRTHINTIYRKIGVSSKIELLRRVESTVATGEAQLAPARRKLPLKYILTALAATSAVLAMILISSWPEDVSGRAVPSIAVLPLEARSSTEEQTRFVDALARDIVTDLAQFSGLDVISADTSFRSEFAEMSPSQIGKALNVRYVLLGSIEWYGQQIRVNMQVLETQTDRIVWAERFQPAASDLLTIRGDLAARVAGIVGPVEAANGRLREAELARIRRLPTDNLQAYDLFLKGMLHWEKFTAEENLMARAAFLQATEVDPTYAKAYAMATWTYLTNVWTGRSEDPEADLAEAIRLSELALSTDQNEPYAHWSAGAVHLFSREHELAVDAYKRAIELNPNGADFLVFLGWALSYRNQTEEALLHMERAQELNPFHPGWYYWDIALAHFVARDYQTSIDVLNQRNPKSIGTYELLAYNHAMLGDHAEAADAIARVLEAKPNLTIEQARRLEPFEHEEDLEHYLDAMRIAGVPEI